MTERSNRSGVKINGNGPRCDLHSSDQADTLARALEEPVMRQVLGQEARDQYESGLQRLGVDCESAQRLAGNVFANGPTLHNLGVARMVFRAGADNQSGQSRQNGLESDSPK